MHIVIDARIINSSTGRYVERLLHYLQKIDSIHTYTVLVRQKDKDYWQPTNQNFTVKVADFADYSFTEQIGLKKLLDSLNADLVHFCMPQQPILYTGKTVTTIHDLTLLNTYNSDKNWFVFHAKQLVGKYVFKKVARKSILVITPTDYVKKSLVDFAHIPEGKVTTTYEAAEIVHNSPVPYKPVENKQFIMYVGSQSDYKNIKRLILAHQSLLTQNPELYLVLVGKTTGKNGQAAGRNKSWSEAEHYKNIIFTGFLPDEQLAWCYKNTSAYVFPSLMEGFGLPGLEAMISGAPVISSNATCLPEVYEEAAQYFNPTDTVEIAEVIQRVLQDKQLQATMTKKGYAQAAKYSWQRMAEQTHQVYMNALDENKT